MTADIQTESPMQPPQTAIYLLLLPLCSFGLVGLIALVLAYLVLSEVLTIILGTHVFAKV